MGNAFTLDIKTNPRLGYLTLSISMIIVNSATYAIYQGPFACYEIPLEGVNIAFDEDERLTTCIPVKSCTQPK